MHPLPTLLKAYLAFKNRLLLATMRARVTHIVARSALLASASDDELREQFSALRKAAFDGGLPESVEIPLFALIREAARRTIQLEPYEEQLLAGLLLSRGMIVQMDTGEGKTLVAPFCAILKTLYGERVVVVTANDYLAQRDAQWMAPLYEFFNISQRVVRTEQYEDDRFHAYTADVVYVASQNLAFDMLRKHHTLSPLGNHPIPLDSVIIDEIDNVLLDQGDVPYSLVLPVMFDVQLIERFNWYVGRFSENVDFTLNRAGLIVEFTEAGQAVVETIALETGVGAPEVGYYCKSVLAAHFLYKKDTDYLVTDGALQVVDRLSGRPLPGSAFPFGVQQAIEIKEGLACTYPRTSINSITLQSLYRQFKTQCGMSGSAVHNALEFRFSYGLSVVPVPPHRASIREDLGDVVYATKAEAIRAVIEGSAAPDDSSHIGLRQRRDDRRPVLIGTTNVEDAEALSSLLTTSGFAHRLLTARNHAEEAAIISEAGRADRITIAARMAGRGVDIVLDPDARAAGGLHVIGLGRQEDRRLDEQLQGRSGRQGDPGSSQFVISLDDDLMRTLGSSRLQKITASLGLDPGVPIEHRIVTRSIKRAQLRLVLQRFYARQLNTQFDRFVNLHRWPLFAERQRMLYPGAAAARVAPLFERYIDHLRALTGAALTESIPNIEDRLRLTLPRSMAALAGTQPAAFLAQLRQLIHGEYARRRRAAEPFADARERLILLRSIDLTWLLFQDAMSAKLQGLFLSARPASTLDLHRELTSVFADTDRSLRLDVDHRAMFHLMRIDDVRAVQEIKYWRGMGLFVGGDWVDTDDDGVRAPELLPTVPASTPSLPPSSPAVLALPPPSAAVSFWTYLPQYVLDQRSRNVDATKIERASAVLEEFRQFLGNDAMAIGVAFDRLSSYLDSLAIKGIPFWVRRGHRQIVLDYFRYLLDRHLVSGTLPLTFKASISRRLRAITTLASQPLFWLQLLYLGGFAAIYRTLIRWPIPTLRDAVRPDFGTPETFPLLDLVDRLLLGGSMRSLTLGCVGAIPFILTGALIRLGNRDAMVSLLLAIPSVVACSLLATLALGSPLVVAQPLPWLQHLLIGLSITAATFTLTALLWIGQFADLCRPISLIVLFNGLVIVWDILVNPITPAAPSSVAISATLIVATCAMFELYRRWSRLSLKLVRVGEFDLASGEMKKKAVSFYADTIGSGDQYLYALLAIVATGYWLEAAASRIDRPDWLLRDSLADWRLFAYPVLVCAFTYTNAMRPFRPKNLREFLGRRDLFVEGARSAAEGVSKVVAAARKASIRNWVFEIALVGLAFLFAATTLDHRRSAPDERLVVAALVLTSCYLLLTIGRRLFSHFSELGATPVLAIPPTLDEELDESWATRSVRWIKQPTGIVAFSLGVTALYELGQLVWLVLRWLFERL